MNKIDPQLIEIIKRAVDESVSKTVNGKIDALDQKANEMYKRLEEHLVEIEPFLDGFKGAKIIGTTVKWIAGVMVAFGTIYWSLKNFFS